MLHGGGGFWRRGVYAGWCTRGLYVVGASKFFTGFFFNQASTVATLSTWPASIMVLADQVVNFSFTGSASDHFGDPWADKTLRAKVPLGRFVPPPASRTYLPSSGVQVFALAVPMRARRDRGVPPGPVWRTGQGQAASIMSVRFRNELV